MTVPIVFDFITIFGFFNFFGGCHKDSALVIGNIWKTQGFCGVAILFIIVMQRRANGEVDEDDLEEAEVEGEHLEKANMEEELLISWPTNLLTY